jgi:hypothetical protein
MKTKQTKQQEAIVRQKEWDSLSLENKAEIVANAPGQSKKQRAKLYAQAEQELDKELEMK